MNKESSSFPRGRSLSRFVKRCTSGLLVLMSPVVLSVATLLLLLALTEEPVEFDTAAARGISYTPLEQVVPSPGLPADLGLMASNNNLDVVEYEGATYFAFRSAPTHFASTKTRLIVLRSKDRVLWEKETEFATGSDSREPRFLVFGGKLFLYFFQGGTNPFGFEPRSIYVTEWQGPGAWTAPEPVYKPGFVVWRAKSRGDTAYMSVYNGAGLYTTGDRAGDLRMLTSKDGRQWEPISDKPQVDRISAEEGEFEFDAEGNLVATVRVEVEGGLVCTASKNDLATWKCTYTPYKYDSALMFRQADSFYVIARRNVAGPFESERRFVSAPLHRAWRLARYSLTRKRTSLYRVDVENTALVPLFDFPSRGDTAYAGIMPLGDGRFYVLNYSCRVEGPDWPWFFGQLAGTRIYSTVLAFETKRQLPE